MLEAKRTARAVVITGGSSGIGRAMAEAFVRNGDEVVIIGRSQDALMAAAQAIGPWCSWQRADVSQREQVSAAVGAIAARYGRIDVLINNAGHSGFLGGMTADTPLDEA